MNKIEILAQEKEAELQENYTFRVQKAKNDGAR
jgi:hypothetical protein